MAKYASVLGLVLFSLLWLGGCDQGALLPNQAPDTRIFLDGINLEGDDRLNSVVQLHWSGEDIDGYVKGFELSFDGQSWTFVTQTDSTFRFDISPGVDTADITFYVRAIDNQDLADPEPAFLSVPIRNTPPTANFDTQNALPDTVYSVGSIFFTVGDQDGLETLDKTFIRVNEGPWIALGPQINFVSFVPTAPETQGVQASKLYVGTDAQLSQESWEGWNVGGDNRLYLRAQDISGTFSPTDSTEAFFLRTKGSDLLVVDDFKAVNPDPVYFPILEQVYPGYDYLNLRDELPPFWDPTFGLFLELYDKVFWYSDGNAVASLSSQLLLEVASSPIREYLNQGGKMFLTTQFPNSFSDKETGNTSRVFDFLPADSLSTSNGQARIPTNNALFPVGQGLSLFPDTLRSSEFISGVDPFYPRDPNNVLLEADVITTGGWIGPRAVCSRDVSTEGTFMVFVSVELHKFRQDLIGLQNFFDTVLNDEFNW
ncbi:MAG: hypothetical protein AAFR61_08320 [Bacteroidota bacterium]